MEQDRQSLSVMNAPTAPSRLKLALTRYPAMGEHGILPRGPRVELIDGEIIGSPPAIAT
jgi:hypothetical protein